MLLHKPTPVMIQIMRGAGVAKEIAQGVKFFKCSDCLEVSTPFSVAAAKPPSLFAFNYEVRVGF